MLRRALLGIALLVLLALAWLGISGGLHGLPQSITVGQRTQSVMQLAYGLFALLSAVTTFWGRRWARLSRAGWILSCALAAGLASIVWGDTGLATGLLSGVGGAAIASVIVWLLHAGVRGPAAGGDLR